MKEEKEIVRGYIYKITNQINGMCYIGKTTYGDIQKRFNQHKYYALVVGGGSEKTVHQAIRDFGIENFKIECIYTVKTPEILEVKERDFIALYHSWIGDPECNGYNQSRGGEGTHYSGNEFSDYLSEKIVSLYEELQNQTKVAEQLKIDVGTVRSYLHLNNIATLDAKTIAINTTGKKVAVYYNNELLAIYPSIGQTNAHIEGTTKNDVRHISEICNGGTSRKHVKGYNFEFTDKDIFNENLYLEDKTKGIESKVTKKKCQMIDIETGKILNTFESGCEAGRYFNMEKPAQATTCIARAIGRNGTWRGYKWKRI